MNSIRFVFPGVLRKLVYEDQTGETRRLVIEDAMGSIHDYFAEMDLGVQYEQSAWAPENRSYPDVITGENALNANRVRARANLESVIGRTVPGLGAIPLDADLFETDAFDVSAAEALTRLDKEIPRVAAAVASKLLYLKRPGYFPIFDEYARRALGLRWTRGETRSEYEAGYQRLLKRTRGAAEIEGNRKALEALHTALAGDPSRTGGVVLSRVRILDILAWHGILRDDPWN